MGIWFLLDSMLQQKPNFELDKNVSQMYISFIYVTTMINYAAAIYVKISSYSPPISSYYVEHGVDWKPNSNIF